MFTQTLDLVQVRAGQGQCEADNYVLTNTVFKTSMSNGLSREGKRQVARQVDVAAPNSKTSFVKLHPYFAVAKQLVESVQT